jgi:putative intracellular protease/amidase
MSTSLPLTKRIGILVFDDFEPLDVWGFVEAFAIARFIGTGYAAPGPRPFEVVLISSDDGAPGGIAPAPVKSFGGPRVAPDIFRKQALGQQLDVLMIPGGFGVAPLLTGAADAVLDWVRAMDERVDIMASVCTGAAVLAKAGLLDGKPAATNHQAFDWVTSFGPRVLWDNISRWVDAGHYVSSAGVSAGTDLGFHLVSRLAGRAVAEQAALGAEYDWHRDPAAPILYPQQAAVPTSKVERS